MHRTTPLPTKIHLLPRRALVLLALACSCFVLPSCNTGGKSEVKDDSVDEIIGRPPPTDDDPFANKALPADAVPASSSGTVGAPDVEVSEPETRPEAKPEVKPEAKPETKPVEPAVAKKAEPVREPESVQPQPGFRCFSCVRICPDSDPTPDCSRTPENIICGWGTSDEERDAKRLARAECDATLDLARGMPRYSRIDGGCPAATCR